ncbi:MAG: phenylalanine--tRNA ligase subunit beta [Sandaracinaceae bacterium]
MKGSYRWLTELTGVDAGPVEVGEALTRVGLEVEDVEVHGADLDHVVIAEVRRADRVEGKDKLRLVTVFDGAEERRVICGAPNVPDPGGRVVLAQPGAVLPGGFAIAERKVGGVLSSGMLCSETELAIGADEGGILVLGPAEPGAPGQPVAEALSLADHVFEIGMTPNRPDCLGHLGLAREVAAAFDVPFAPPGPGMPRRLLGEPPETTEEGLLLVEGRDQLGGDTLTFVRPDPGMPTRVPVTIEDPDRCPRYAAAVVHGVRVRRSPFWLRYRLHVLGLRPIDAIVDATNLVLMELGHPTHAFDLRRLAGPEIRVRRATAGERMRTLDDVERTFTDDDLLICDGAGPVAVAGVMGGADSEIRPDTTAVVLEVAYFDPRSVRRTSRRLGLHTDASYRFERGVDPNGVPYALRRATSLFVALAGGAADPVAVDRIPRPIRPVTIDLDPEHPARLLGLAVDPKRSRQVLSAVGCQVRSSRGRWRVTVPTFRPDLTRPEDLVEEVARIEGYDKVPTEVPAVRPSGRGYGEGYRFDRALRRAAVATGLLEARTFAFVSPEELARARVPTEAVPLANPLSEERSVMRTSLVPALLGAVGRAQRHQAASARLFELGRVFRRGERLPEERAELVFVLAGPRQPWFQDEGPVDFFDGKGVATSIVETAFGAALEAEADESLEEEAPYLHPRRRARLRIGGQPVGVLGELHPDVADAFDLDGRVVVGLIAADATRAALAARGLPQAEELPRYPAVQRDVALVVEDNLPMRRVAEAIREAGAGLVETVELFDVYQGASIPDGRKSLAFRIVYRDVEATLTDKKVDKAHGKVLKALQDSLGARPRT